MPKRGRWEFRTADGIAKIVSFGGSYTLTIDDRYVGSFRFPDAAAIAMAYHQVTQPQSTADRIVLVPMDLERWSYHPPKQNRRD